MSTISDQKRQSLDNGGKIILPASALAQLMLKSFCFPFVFKLSNVKNDRHTHCGVEEFEAEEGRVHLPLWMINNLLLREGSSLVHIESVSLNRGSFVKFQPKTKDFLDIDNARAVVKNALRTFTCLTIGDLLPITYKDKIYELHVVETKPSDAIVIMECDMNVNFAAPVGYKDPSERKSEDQYAGEEEPMAVDSCKYIDASRFQVFGGQGNRLDGKSVPMQKMPDNHEPLDVKRGIPNYNYRKGKITFIRTTQPANGSPKGKEETDGKRQFVAFSGKGFDLRKKTNKE